LLLSPYIPLLFMGDEYGETAPFLYFVDHGDPGLNDRVYRGRLQDHPEWIRDDLPPPRPAAKSSFRRSRLRFDRRNNGQHRLLWLFHQRLLHLRKTLAPWQTLDRRRQQVTCDPGGGRWLASRRTAKGVETLALLHFGDQTTELCIPASGPWETLLDSADTIWGGPGSATPATFVVDSKLSLTVPPNSATVLIKRTTASEFGGVV
ncbi:MAG: DUF3459 domain-containing protein, partial [Planctomycetota bacterium]